MSRTTKFELAKQDKTTELSDYIDFILERIGFPEALVTDESKIGDFIDLTLFNKSGLTENGQKYLDHISFLLGVKVKDTDFLWEVATKLAKAMS